jgi:hypothetical protein
MEITTVTDRHLEIAMSLSIEGYLAYLLAREAGQSHIYAMALGQKASQR